MAVLARGTKSASLTTPTPPSSSRVARGYCATDIPAGTPCYQGTNGSINISTGVAANAAAVVDGWTMDDYKAGEYATLYNDVTIGYGVGSAVVPGTFYYLGTAGALSDAATTGGTMPIARGFADTNITGTKLHKLRVFRSY
jgi:hypothetical protein